MEGSLFGHVELDPEALPGELERVAEEMAEADSKNGYVR